MEMPEDWPELLDGIEGEREQAAVLGRFAVLQAARLGFSDYMNRRIARSEIYEKNRRGEIIPMSFHRSICKAWVSTYGDQRGLDLAEIEVTADMLGVADFIYETPLETVED